MSTPQQFLLRDSALAIEAGKRYQMSAPALHTARELLNNFEIRAVEKLNRNPPLILADESNLGLMVDVCTQLFRLVPFLEQAEFWRKQLVSGNASAEDIRRLLDDLILALKWMPTFRR